MRTPTMTMVMLLMAAGCTQAGAGPQAGVPRAIEGEEIRYATSPCFGTCPVYAVTIRPDGSGTFEGERFTAVTGTRAFKATPETYRRFAALLAPYKPANERLVEPGAPDCGNPPTDMPGVDVRWSEASGGSSHLRFYNGCRIGNEPLAQALDSAPAALPIAAFIGKR